MKAQEIQKLYFKSKGVRYLQYLTFQYIYIIHP